MIIYLYKKTHCKTGLHYLGQTTAKDPMKYPGSGIYWRKHLKVHGRDIETEVLRECHSKEEVKEWGEHYSKLWNVSESSEWANLKDETGDGGKTVGYKHSDEAKRKISEARKGKKLPPEHCESISKAKLGISWGHHTETTKKRFRSFRHSDEFKKTLSEDRRGSNNPMYGKTDPTGARELTLHTFRHLDGRVELCTQYELRTKYNLNSGNLWAVINRRKNLIKGWVLIALYPQA
jgi:hypothetical protein